MGNSGRARRRRTFLIFSAATVATVMSPRTSIGAEPKPALRKRSREEVKYQNEPYLGRTCAKCVLYQGDGVCVILDGAVSPNGWCSQWVPNTMG